jgi:two-component sensor histidine kinase
LEASSAVLNLDVAVPLGLVLSELIANAMKHGLKDSEHPTLKVLLEEEKECYHLRVKDNGVGLPDGFTLENPTSFGLEIIVALTNQIDAEITFKNDQGACFDIRFHA